MPTEYIQDKELADAVTDMLADDTYHEFDPIRNHEVKIESCLCVRVDDKGENAAPKPEPATLKKVGAVEKLFVDADYILVVDNSAWVEANEVQKGAIIHRGLMKINIEAGEGKIKIGTRKPNIVEFTETVARFGAYNEPLLGFRDAFKLAAKTVAQNLQIENV
jgi:hypothetical protein